MTVLTRRSLLKTSAAAAAAAPVVAYTNPVGMAQAVTTVPQFVGHKPGKIYLGVSGIGFEITAKTGPVGLRRTFHKWGGGTGEDSAIRADHAANRLPWISFKPPGSPDVTWKQIGDGLYDADIRARARRYAAFTKPVVVTFNHEPHTDAAPPAEFVRAWCRIHDVMKAETALKNVISAPILGEWTWNPKNQRHKPEWWMSDSVLSRCHFMGIDLYQNKTTETYRTRLARVLDWLDVRGHNDKMVGIGETACSDDFLLKAAPWWTDSWAYGAARTDRFFAVSYFNNLYNNNQGYNWLLTQSSSKLNAFTASVRSTTATML
ncbi:MAG: twin-arginine translocation signal domain-containing protein [Nocardioides sp.]